MTFAEGWRRAVHGLKAFFRLLSLVVPSLILWALSGSFRLGLAWITITLIGSIVVRSLGLSRLLGGIDWVASHLPFGGLFLGPLLRSARIAAEVLPAVSHPETKGGLYRRVALLLEEACR